MCSSDVCRILWAKRNILIVLLTPLLLLPIPILIPTPAGKVGYVVLMMIVFLLVEAIPLPIVGLFPAIFFPLMGIDTAKTVSESYLNDTLLFIVAVMIVASAIESTNLHRRIVLRCLLLAGSNPYRIECGLMCSSFFLSMFIPNVAVLPMMMPIALGIIDELDKDERMKIEGKLPSLKDDAAKGEVKDLHVDSDITNVIITTAPKDAVDEEETKQYYRAGKYILLGLLYGINLGGSATLIGTTQPPIANGQMEIIYGPESAMTYGKWLAFSFPLEFLCLVFTYIWIVFMMWQISRHNKKRYIKDTDTEETIGNSEMKLVEAGKKAKSNTVEDYIRNEALKMGRLTWAEGCTIVLIFILTLLLCFTKMDDVDGWFSLFPEGYTSNTCATCVIAVLFFILPNDFEQFRLKQKKPRKYQSILKWNFAIRRVPWGVVLLVGGYFSLGKALKETKTLVGLESIMTDAFQGVDDWIIVLAITCIVAVLTEFVGNIPVILVFIPVCTTIATVKATHPHLYVMPMVLASQMSLMLPIATAPNLVFQAYGNTSTIDMVKGGWMVNVISLIWVNILVNTYGYVIYNFDSVPAWASPGTTMMPTVANVTQP